MHLYDASFSFIYFLIHSYTQMETKKPKTLVIVGATASGKTSLSIKLAKQFNGEVISADSRQIYRKLDIGSGKVTKEEMDGISHHLIDIVDVGDTYNATDFKRDGEKIIAEITERNALPIIAGGTFFYVDTLLGRITAPAVPPNPALRTKLEALSTEELYAELRERDPERATTIDPNNGRRLVRALEIVASLGKVPVIPTSTPYDTLILGVQREKEELRNRFHARATEWLTNGFMDEIKSLLDSGITESQLQEIGFEYLLGVEFFKGELTEVEFLQKFVEKNWQYAKTQNTWLKKDDSIVWVDANNLTEIETVITNWLDT